MIVSDLVLQLYGMRKRSEKVVKKKRNELAPFYFYKVKLSPREEYRTEEVPVSSSSHDAL